MILTQLLCRGRTGAKLAVVDKMKTPTDFNVPLKIMILGDSNVGKTSFIHRFADGKFSDKYITTVGIDFREKTIELPDENRKICLQVKLF